MRADAAMHDPSLRWCLLEYRIDVDDMSREQSRYISLSAPKAIVAARRAAADAKAVHPGDLSTLELDFDDAEQRWTNACRQKIQALRVKLTDMRAHGSRCARVRIARASRRRWRARCCRQHADTRAALFHLSRFRREQG
ncbi:hypothetical protein PTKU46_18960 [Paraburkholderia terrae]|uniref:hypothetical protein n=1 Tax=Paraburkholderia terrae TaxID=311230 RepID=UPI0030E4A5DF